MKLGSDLDPLDATPERLREHERGAAATGGDVEHPRARPEPQAPPEQQELLLRRRVLELVILLRDDEVARDHERDSLTPPIPSAVDGGA